MPVNVMIYATTMIARGRNVYSMHEERRVQLLPGCDSKEAYAWYIQLCVEMSLKYDIWNGM